MTTQKVYTGITDCPAQDLLRMLSGKWKAQILRVAHSEPVRFNNMLRLLPEASKQSLAQALKELEDDGVLSRTVIRQKPLHVEYTLTEKGRAMMPVFELLGQVAKRNKTCAQ